MGFTIYNYGKQPAKLIRSRTRPIVSSQDDFNDFGRLPKDAVPLNINLPEGAKIPLELQDSAVLREGERDSIMSGKLYVYLLSEMTYVNTATDSIKTWYFNYRVSLFPRFKVVFITDSIK